MIRVCRRGGRVGLANWTPDGFIGELFAVIGGYSKAPPARASTPFDWGTGSASRSCLACTAGSKRS